MRSLRHVSGHHEPATSQHRETDPRTANGGETEVMVSGLMRRNLTPKSIFPTPLESHPAVAEATTAACDLYR